MAKNRLTKEQERRFDEKFPVEEFEYGSHLFVSMSRINLKSYLADEIALAKREVYESMGLNMEAYLKKRRQLESK